MDDFVADSRARATFDSSPIGLALLDADGGVLRANAALRELTELFDAVGSALFDDPFDLEGMEVSRADLAAIFGGDLPEVVNRLCLRAADAAEVWVEVSVYPAKEPDGEISCATFILENITEEVRAAAEVERSELTNRTLLRAIPDLIFRVTADGTFLDYSPGSEAHALVRADTILGATIEGVLPEPQGQQSMACLRRALQSDGVVHQQFELWFGTDLRFLEARYAAIADDEALIIVRDVTDEKWRELGREALHAISDIVLRAERVDGIYDAAPKALAEGFGFPLASIELYNPSSSAMGVLGAHGVGALGVGRQVVPCDGTVAGRVARSAEPFATDDLAAHTDHTAPIFASEQPRAVLCVPMLDEEGVVGAVCLADTRVRAAPSVLVDAVATVANYLGEAITRRRARSDLRSIIAAAQCLLWEADVTLVVDEQHPTGSLEWDPRPLDAESAQRFLPLDVQPGEAYEDALFRAMAPEGRMSLDRVSREAVLGGEAGYTQEFRCSDRAGAVRWLHADVFVRPRGDGHRHCVGVCTDITERKRAERAKDDFLAAVSHELRTPLTSIKGAIELLVDGSAGEVTQQGQGLLDIALSNAERLTRLVNDVLDISTLESHAGAFNIETMELAPLLAQSLDGNRPFVDKLGVELVLQDPVPGVFVGVDGGRFAQLVSNLVINAAKFSPPDGRVTVAMTIHDGWARVSVRDDGPGIPESAWGTLFDRFTQVDGSTTRDHDGTGLGLAIARGIVERLGGRIDLTSEVGVGSTFFFDLPVLESGG